MKQKILVGLSSVLILLSLTGCSFTREDFGIAAGAVGGGIAGSALTRGSTAGTVAGAVGGAFLGREVARRSY